MLMKCPECDLPASDKALSCPHCGYPFQQNPSKPKYRKSNKRRRLPNGFGQISELKGRNLRKPFRAMVTIAKDEYGKPICKLLKPEAYFETYNDAYEALLAYNKNPYDLSTSVHMQELFERWFEYHSTQLKSESSKSALQSSWNYCSFIANMKVSEVRAKDIRKCIKDGFHVVGGKTRPITPVMQIRVKQLLSMMFDYAVEYEMTDKNYARLVNISDITSKMTENKKGHVAFTNKELNLLWSNIGIIPYVELIIIQCYTGWRPQELVTIKTDDVNIKENYIIGGMKTSAGKGRYVPIHPKIKNLIEYHYNNARKYKSDLLFCRSDEEMSERNLHYRHIIYQEYRIQFAEVMRRLKLSDKHLPHDCRKTFITLAKRYKVDEYAIKYIVGHSIKDLTERVYTDRDNAWLNAEIEKIK